MYLSSKQRVSAWCCMALEKSIRTNFSKYLFKKTHIQYISKNKTSDLQRAVQSSSKKSAGSFLKKCELLHAKLPMKKKTAGLAPKNFFFSVTKLAVRTNTKQLVTNLPGRDTELTSCQHSWNLRITTHLVSSELKKYYTVYIQACIVINVA